MKKKRTTKQGSPKRGKTTKGPPKPGKTRKGVSKRGRTIKGPAKRKLAKRRTTARGSHLDKTPRKRRRVVMARLIRMEDDDGSFDAEFWRRVGPEGRMAAMWDLVVRYWQIKGRDPRELEFDRSVAVLKRREGAVPHRRGARRRAP